MRTRKMLCAFLKTCRAVQLLHACVVKFKVSGTVVVIIIPLCVGGITGNCRAIYLILPGKLVSLDHSLIQSFDSNFETKVLYLLFIQ